MTKIDDGSEEENRTVNMWLSLPYPAFESTTVFLRGNSSSGGTILL
jgi:hypothetical protein